MAGVDLRPLSLGEILDRTFTLYRGNFVLFIGITAIPMLLSLAVNLVGIMFGPSSITLPISPGTTPNIFSMLQLTGGSLVLSLVTLVVTVIAYLFSQGGTILAVSDLYLGRPTSIGGSLSRVSGEIGSLFGVVFLNGLAVLGGFILLIVPGVYLMCRLLVCVPSALIENRGPRESLRRSFELTRGSAGRSFVILLLSVVLSFGVGLIFSAPLAAIFGLFFKEPGMFRLLSALTQVSGFISNVLVSPVLLIATSVYYYDLRVRKEAFDLQFMIDPNSQRTPGTGDVPSILS